jgi:glycosyltransferase involved in cell wall biosynthesis
VCAIVPCFNIAALCGPVVREAAHLVDRVIAIDDGSSDETRAVLEQVARYHPGRVRVLAFDVNRGKGAALLAAFRLAVSELPFDYLVTLDGDGQHCPRDIPRLLHGFEHGGEFVIGSRAGAARIPWRSRFGNALTTKILNLIARDCPRDTQSGFRGLSRQFVVEVLREVGGARYELELRILLLALHQRRRIAEVPIPTIYLDENRSSHFRPLEDSLRIYAALFRHGLPLMVGARARRKSS